jgi:KUP system potassium uptake protein
VPSPRCTATPAFSPYIVPISVAIIMGIFLLQYRGTASVGAMFGPVMIVWFVVIAGMGVRWIALEPHVLSAVNPVHAARFFANNGYHGFCPGLGVPGRHRRGGCCGHGPLRRRADPPAWFAMVFRGCPELLGRARSCCGVRAADQLFTARATALVMPLVGLATAAASSPQALISPSFDDRQAVQLVQPASRSATRRRPSARSTFR